MRVPTILIAAVLLSSPASSQTINTAVVADSAPDAQYPADVAAFVLPSHDGALNAVMYMAAGKGPHPTLLLLHGFPGNEQNLDLAQAVRRAGWNVLTLHYRGSWGSKGSFSFTHAAQDAATALAALHNPQAAARLRVDPKRIAVAGHSMGGFMAADCAADDKGVLGLALIDPWNIATTAQSLGSAEGMAAWKAEAESDLPPLAGTSLDALTGEMKAGGERFDLDARVTAYGDRPLLVIGAERGIAKDGETAAEAGRAEGMRAITEMTWPTDHSFSDRRIALASALVDWLQMLVPPKA